MLLKEPHCHGFIRGKTQTVQKWIDEQGIAIYNRINDKLMEIISLKNRQTPGALDIKTRHLFFTALYDLDSFRSKLSDNGSLADFRLSTALVDKALEDDVALLEVGMEWIKGVLLGWQSI